MAHPQIPLPPPPPPTEVKKKAWPRRHKFLTVLGVIVIFIIAAVTVSSGGSGDNTTASVTGGTPATSGATHTTTAPVKRPSTGHDPKADFTVTSCTADDVGYADAKVKVTNNTSKASNYFGEIVFESADGRTQIGTGQVAVNELAPGQSSVVDANSLATAAGKFTCRVGEVTRYATG